MSEGGSRRAAARRFGVSAAKKKRGSAWPSARRRRDRWPGPPAGSGKLSACRDIVIAWVETQGDLTLAELVERLAPNMALPRIRHRCAGC